MDKGARRESRGWQLQQQLSITKLQRLPAPQLQYKDTINTGARLLRAQLKLELHHERTGKI